MVVRGVFGQSGLDVEVLKRRRVCNWPSPQIIQPRKVGRVSFGGEILAFCCLDDVASVGRHLQCVSLSTLYIITATPRVRCAAARVRRVTWCAALHSW